LNYNGGVQEKVQYNVICGLYNIMTWTGFCVVYCGDEYKFQETLSSRKRRVITKETCQSMDSVLMDLV